MLAAMGNVTRLAKRQMLHCDECETPVAEVRADCIIIKSRHHNQWHVTVIPFEQLCEWMTQSGPAT